MTLYDGISIEFGANTHHKKNSFIIYPWASWKKIWDICMGGIKMYYCFAIPYYLGFDNHHEGQPIGLDTFFDIVLFMDILLKLSTSFIKDNKIIEDRDKILIKSLKEGILIDIVCVVPLYVVYNQLMWFRILRLLQVHALKKALERTVRFM